MTLSSKPPSDGPKSVALFGAYAPSLMNFRAPLIAELLRRGYRVFALAPDFDEDTRSGILALGATPVPITLSRKGLQPLAALRSRRELVAVLRDIQPEALIAYTIKPIIIGGGAAKAAGVRRFVPMITGLGYAFTGGLAPRRMLIKAIAVASYRRALRTASIVIFQNPDDRRSFASMGILAAGARTAIVNGSGVDLDHFAEKPFPDEVSFLMVARFLRYKGIGEYAAAAARLKAERPEVRIALAGWIDESPGSISPSELDAIAASGVHLYGKLDDVRSALAASSVFVLPSHSGDGTPRSVLEAMAVGRAVITTNSPGCRETVVDGVNGFLVPPRDAEALYRAMRRFVDDPSLARQMGEASRGFAEAKYEAGAVSRDILDHAGL